MKTINVLGTEYTVEIRSDVDDAYLKECDGYTDKTSKAIVVAAPPSDNELENYEVYQKKVLRHEIIHAFLLESGLHECWTHNNGHDETYVDWIAVQFPKLLKAFEEADAL